MKAAFEIQDHEPIDLSTQVLVEVGDHGLSVLKFRKDPLTINAVSIFNFLEGKNGNSHLENVRSALSRVDLVSRENLHVFFNFQEALIIPSEFMHEHTFSSQLDLIYGLAPFAEPAFDEIIIDSGIGKQDRMFCAYRTPAGIRNLAQEISGNRLKHSTSVQIKLTGTNVLHCTIFPHTIKLMLYGNNQLLMVQQCKYTTPADVVYHLLNLCDKYDVSNQQVSLNIDGMIESDSNLYSEIHKYFLHVHFNVISDDVFLAAGIQEHPGHFITHLTELARCV